MEVIIDTHIFLWFINGDKKLKKTHKEIIELKDNTIYLSVASIWECVIKEQIGKIKFPEKPSKYLSQKRMLHQIESLDISEKTIYNIEGLPLLHKDPFDRIIIAQALENNYKILTEDKQILDYKLPLFIFS